MGKEKEIPKGVWGAVLLISALVWMMSLVSYHDMHPAHNWIGICGNAIAWATHYLFGAPSYLLPLFTGWMGGAFLFNSNHNASSKTLFFALFLFSLCSLLAPFAHGGIPSQALYQTALKPFFGKLGSLIICSITLLSSFYFLTRINPLSWIKKKEKIPFEPALEGVPLAVLEEEETPTPPPRPKKQIAPTPKPPPQITRKTFEAYTLPPPSLLTNAKKSDTSQLKNDLKTAAKTLEETLMSFAIEAKVQNVQIGPTIASFEVQPSSGVKVQKIKALENDIALNMQAKSIRIIAPIPGKAAVGIEIPNPYPQEVGFKELIENYHASQKRSAVPLLLGKGVSGEDVWADLSKMPHLIIAGATGSGKSVCINTIVMSILMNAHPSEIKLLMVDPKKVELTAYSPLPHMLAPVITEAAEAHAAFHWLVKEMERRYEIFRQLSIRNIVSFNERKANPEVEATLGMEIPKELPYIVAIVDELADLMMVSQNDIETPIARIAQMARAVGIHLILATQRPSREVLTGLIKANFPTRIAFKVASRINSQIIIDDNGAESLLGNGDMLFMPPGTSSLIRAQGAFIRDDDITKVIDFICKQMPAQYLIPSFKDYKVAGASKSEDDDFEEDSLYDEAKSIILETGNASTTFLQRKLKIGYARAASLMDQLEANRIVGPADGAKPRKIFYPEQKG